ncbi:uncharacterized protein PFL1_04239 [Pseudozyma flocculosa PF-1]|uniref:Uncharacterized protein n=2 Tax=Pseudozyma flocculosa TaxID=84751 RepID=A0A5C3ETA4_9BASI|nr:uncharacterized protein PFL1_04239 [Pseudozyma flocculosa PF-1]EPQ28412.1 hypothetical protein PFL1_04239 [Pseudozyma flocculosa PF-1]SPO35574.1 uncharacterized protein PSFLO_01045 [Pseudozyma flocculosa]
MSRRQGPTSLAVQPGSAAASGPAQDVVLRHLAHTRAAHGGSGSNTEMRAILRKEREVERARASSSLSNRENEPPARRMASTASSMITSLSDRKLTQNSSSSSSLGAGSAHGTDDGQEPLAPAPASGAPSSRWPAHSRRPSSAKGSAPISAGLAKNVDLTQQRQVPTSDREGSVSSASSRIPAPPDSFDHSFGVDALQAAFSAKYYELANKCKNWERYAAKLRAQSEAVEIENRVLREQIAQLEADNAALRHEQLQRDQALYRRDVESRLSTLEERLPGRIHSGDDLDERYRSGDTLIDLDRISAPSAPSSASKSSDGRHQGQMTYCSSNLQVEDRPELRPPTPVSALSLPTMLPSVPRPQELGPLSSGPGRRSLNHAHEESHEWPPYNNKRDSASLAEIINQDAAHREFGALYGEGRSSRLGSRRAESDVSVAGSRLPTSATFPPGPNSASNDASALTSQALAAMNRQHAAMVGGQQAPSANRLGQGNLRPTQGKRRSTISVDRTLDPGLQQLAGIPPYSSAAAPGAASAGVDARSRGPSVVSEAATVTGDYLQEYVEQRRQQRKTSFTVQQQQQHSAPLGAAQSGSRPASRLSNHSAGGDRTRRARSRAGSVHDAIPMLKDDVFSDGAAANTAPSRSGGASPLAENVNVINGANLYADRGLGANSPSPQSKQRSALMEIRCSQPMLSSDTSHSSQSLHSGIADYSNSSTELSDAAEDQRRAHRALYASLRAELDAEDLVKFEKYVHRYDALEIGLDGPRGLINRVKKLLLLTDPDLKSKPEKLRVRKELAREFEKVVKNTAS